MTRIRGNRSDDYQTAGVVGVRVNLIGEDPGFLEQSRWQELFRRVAARGWLVQVHAPGAAIPAILDHLWPSGAALLIDHFGRPDPALGLDDPGFQAILARAASGRLWVKLSAPYRWDGVAAEPYVQSLLQAFGPARLAWGSDWPWTRTANSIDFPRLRRWLSDWLPDQRDQAPVLGDTTARLFHFDEAASDGRLPDPRLGDWAPG